MLKNSELKTKDVIDINSGKKLGYISDIDIEVERGQIKAFMIPVYQNRLFSFFLKKNDQIISWEEIKLIGEDVILVDLAKDSSLKKT
ncbi:MAG: YlmC/YmxH family sporulation protein [Halanaerobiaceae bacterium]|nr:YlmC/YmxH family sporulation protein [Halanaerobiaceae bacterium]